MAASNPDWDLIPFLDFLAEMPMPDCFLQINLPVFLAFGVFLCKIQKSGRILQEIHLLLQENQPYSGNRARIFCKIGRGCRHFYK